MTSKENVCAHFQCVGPGAYLPVVEQSAQWQSCPWCRIAELERDVARYEARRPAALLKRATFLLGTLCLATGQYPDHVKRLLDEADEVLNP